LRNSRASISVPASAIAAASCEVVLSLAVSAIEVIDNPLSNFCLASYYPAGRLTGA
jgi:hypothetical protein